MATHRFLLVDDEPHVTHLVSYKLKQENIEVVTAQDGAEAFRLACENSPNLVITDLQMPVLSGYEMSVKLRANRETANIPILMLAARGHTLSDEKLAKTNIKQLIARKCNAGPSCHLAEQVKFRFGQFYLFAKPCAQDLVFHHQQVSNFVCFVVLFVFKKA